MIDRHIKFFGFASGSGAGNDGTKDGAGAFFKSTGFMDLVHEFDLGSSIQMIGNEGQTKFKKSTASEYIHNAKAVLNAMSNLRDALSETSIHPTPNQKTEFPVVVGGDHSQALGTVAGVQKAVGPDSKLGLIWIDAHLDAHTHHTTPSKNAHGMPLASMLGAGLPEFINMAEATPLIAPESLVIIGARSFEPEEAMLLAEYGVTIFHANDILNRGFDSVFLDAIRQVSANSDHFGISLDLDVFDPEFVPGVGTPEPGGLIPKKVVNGLSHLKNCKKFSWFELSEYNPHLDQNLRTIKVMCEILTSLLKSLGCIQNVQENLKKRC